MSQEKNKVTPSTLYLVATPIGNLEDITFRVLRTLKEVDLIAAEDTRNSIKLLNHFDIHTPMTSYHEYNKIEKGREKHMKKCLTSGYMYKVNSCEDLMFLSLFEPGIIVA